MLNLLTTPNLFLREAFDALEGKKFFDFSIKGFNGGKHSIDAAFGKFDKLIDEGRLSRLSDQQQVVSIIYGTGGGHRYFVYADGTIKFSTHHCHCGGLHDSAVKRGFQVFPEIDE